MNLYFDPTTFVAPSLSQISELWSNYAPESYDTSVQQFMDRRGVFYRGFNGTYSDLRFCGRAIYAEGERPKVTEISFTSLSEATAIMLIASNHVGLPMCNRIGHDIISKYRVTNYLRRIVGNKYVTQGFDPSKHDGFFTGTAPGVTDLHRIDLVLPPGLQTNLAHFCIDAYPSSGFQEELFRLKLTKFLACMNAEPEIRPVHWTPCLDEATGQPSKYEVRYHATLDARARGIAVRRNIDVFPKIASRRCRDHYEGNLALAPYADYWKCSRQEAYNFLISAQGKYTCAGHGKFVDVVPDEVIKERQQANLRKSRVHKAQTPKGVTAPF